MRSSLFFFLGLGLAACSGNDVSIGANDSGTQDPDSATGNDGSTGQDTGVAMDSGSDSRDPNDSGNPGKDGGIVLDSGSDGGCTGKAFSFQCGQNVCNGGDSQYCSPYPNMCANTPSACKCNYTCKCLLANLPACLQGTLACQMGGNALYLSCN